MRRVAPDSPFAGQPARRALDLYQAMYASFAEKLTASGEFGEAEQWRFDRQREYARDEWLDLLPTTGGLTRLTAEQVLAAVGAAIDGDGFTMDYMTLAVTAPSVVPGRGRR